MVVRCGHCSCKLEVHQPFRLFSLKDEVLTLKCGECALVVSRSYLLTAATIVVCVILYVWSAGDHAERHVFTATTWPEYLQDCGEEVMLQNAVRANNVFVAKYQGKTVAWDGYLMKATENHGWFRGDHAAVIVVKMSPSESDIHADLLLSMDEDDFRANTKALASLDRGSRFLFNATFVAPGNEHQLHHLHAHSIEKAEGYLEIKPHVHSVSQRYNLNTQFGQSAMG
jgi:hypothetical protein